MTQCVLWQRLARKYHKPWGKWALGAGDPALVMKFDKVMPRGFLSYSQRDAQDCGYDTRKDEWKLCSNTLQFQLLDDCMHKEALFLPRLRACWLRGAFSIMGLTLFCSVSRFALCPFWPLWITEHILTADFDNWIINATLTLFEEISRLKITSGRSFENYRTRQK